MIRPYLLLTTNVLVPTVAAVLLCAQEGNGRVSPDLEPLYDSGMPLLSFPKPGDSLSYDEIVWPWELNVGDWGWGGVRYSAWQSTTTWRNSGTARIGFWTADGKAGERFSPQRDKAYRITATTTDPTVCDIFKYFPEVRELKIQIGYDSREDLSLGDALAVLRYCPYLTKLEIYGESFSSTLAPPKTGISEESLKAIGTLTQLRVLRFYELDVDDDELQHLAGMKNLLFFDLNHARATTEVFPIIATWPRIRYVKLCGCDFDQPLNDSTAEAMESLVGRLELLWTNEGDLEAPETKIHESLEAPIAKIRANAHLARQPREEKREPDREATEPEKTMDTDTSWFGENSLAIIVAGIVAAAVLGFAAGRRQKTMVRETGLGKETLQGQ